MLQTIEERFLEECKEKPSIKIILRNGFQMRGRIIDFDEEVIILESYFEAEETRRELIYKDYISTVTIN